MHTLSSAADLIGNLDRLDSDGKAQRHAQLRNLYAKGLVTAVREAGGGRTAAVRLSLLETARARILTTLIDLGFDASVHIVVNAALDRQIRYLGSAPPSAKTIGGARSHGGLRDVLRGIAMKEDWHLRIDLFRLADGKKEVSARFLWPGEGASQEEMSEIVNMHYERRPLATVNLPLTDLLAVFVG